MIKYCFLLFTIFYLNFHSTIGSHGKIVGRVTTSDTSIAIVGANIILDSLTTTLSDQRGWYQFNDVKPGPRIITISAQKFCPIIRYNIRVIPDFVTRCDFKLTIYDTCSYPIVDLNERPLIKKDSIMELFENVKDYKRYKELMDSLGFKEGRW